MPLPHSGLRHPSKCQDRGHGDVRVVLARVGTRMTCRTSEGGLLSGLDFVTQDYLGLSAHPALHEAAIAALESGAGLHSAGLAPLAGLSESVLELEARLAAFLRVGQATVFPSGADANRGAMRALVQAGDHVILDAEAHPSLAEAALALGVAVHRSPPGSLEAVERRLCRLRRSHPGATILVAVSAISATSAGRPDLPAMIELCRERHAMLLVDVAHDLGAMGTTGRGVMELEGCLGRVDVMTGSFAKTFGVAGGFVASRERGLKAAMRMVRGGQMQTAALSSLQAQVILRAFDLIEGEEGIARRRKLIGNVRRLRNHLGDDGWTLMGRDAPFVPVRLPPDAVASGLAGAPEPAGMFLAVLQAPVVAGHVPRWRIHLRCDHSVADIDNLAAALLNLQSSRLLPRSFAQTATARRGD